ncbi:hypothetical protein NO2_1255 [Candidatus Termititenax persephonae]|uniref:Uncharacterized protein n=1 Tax=Candidatus Termititenax persephonae TaxID=2218525 RepID=A0A388TJ24_9BACT|nr:hypothetical protein NO2_1255 [Candidatus Termititenax persephonae]
MPGLVVNRTQPDMVKSVIIENPQLELDLLRRFAALRQDGRTGGTVGIDYDINGNIINADDYGAETKTAQNLITQLQGLSLYWNDNCPWHESLATFYDFGSALLMLESIRKELGDAAFRNSKVVFEELLFGLDFKKIERFKNVNFAPNEPPHHVITKAYSIPRDGSLPETKPSLRSLSQNTKEVLLNLQLYKNSNALLSWVIERPARELQLLREIAGSDGQADNISSADMRSSAFQDKLRQLEGYRLYTNDPGEDATQADLNNAYALLRNISGRFTLEQTNVLLTEKMSPDNGRRTIQGGQVLYGNYAEAKNFDVK